MTDNISACEKVAALYETKVSEGLLDVKFLLQSVDEVTKESVCKDILALEQAVSEGKVEQVDFSTLD